MGCLKETGKIFEVPFSRNKRFNGRKKELDILKKNLESENIQSIAGVGGIGKTQLAVEYSYLNIDEYNVIFWINAVDKPSIIEGYLKLASKIGYDVTKGSEEVIEYLFKWLSSNDKWLILLDNIEDIKLIDNVVPNFAEGHYIVTTKDPNKCQLIREPLILEEFSKIEAEEFIKNNLSCTDDTNCSLLANKLGFLPIALEQAVSYIDTNSIDIKAYLDLYEQYKLKLLDRGKELDDHKESIFNTWNISIDKIKSKNPNAILIAKLLSFFDSNNISREIINKIDFKDIFNIDINQLDLTDAIGILKKYSIVSANSEYLSMHCIVQHFLIQYIDNEENYMLLENLSCHMNNILPLNVITLEQCKIYLDVLNHCRKLLYQIIDYEIYSGDVVDLLVKTSMYLRKNGELDEALEYCLKANKMQKSLTDYKCCTPSGVFNVIAGLYSEKMDFKNALFYYNESLNKLKNSQELDKKFNFIIIKNNIALIDKKLGNYTKSKEELKLCLRELTLLESSEEILKVKISVLSNLAVIQKELEELDNALMMSKEAYELSKQIYGYNNILYARELNNYATIISYRGDDDDAISLYEESISIYIECMGEDNKELPNGYNNLAKSLLKIKKYKEALEYLDKAIQINKRFYEDDHYSFAALYETLGYVNYEKNEYEKAYVQFNKSVEIIKRYIEKNIRLTILYRFMGLCQVRMGNEITGKNNFEKSIGISKQLFSTNLNLYFNSVYNIAIDLIELGYFNISIEYLNVCKKVLNTTNNDEKNQRYNVYLYLGAAYAKIEEYLKAIKCYNKCLQVAIETKNIDSIAHTYSNLASMYSFLDNSEKTFEYLRKAVKIDRENFLRKDTSEDIKGNVEIITKLKYKEFLI